MSFSEHYGISSDATGLIKTTYFSFTTFSTVGFGDFAPQTDSERIMCSFALLFGVAIFSYIMGEFTSMLEKIKTINKDKHEEIDEELSKFFGVLKSFNQNEPIDKGIQEEIHDFFSYKEEHDRNSAFQLE